MTSNSSEPARSDALVFFGDGIRIGLGMGHATRRVTIEESWSREVNRGN